jgi:hypothetical protein
MANLAAKQKSPRERADDRAPPVAELNLGSRIVATRMFRAY